MQSVLIFPNFIHPGLFLSFFFFFFFDFVSLEFFFRFWIFLQYFSYFFDQLISENYSLKKLRDLALLSY